MNYKKLAAILLASLFLTCAEPPVVTPSYQAEAENAIDGLKARKLSDLFASNLIINDRQALLGHMEKAAREHFGEEKLGDVIDQMVDLQGKPLESEFKYEVIGRRTGTGGYDKPMRKFWYALRTTKYEKGTVYLFVEVVPDEGGLASSGFAMVTFPAGIPDILR